MKTLLILLSLLVMTSCATQKTSWYNSIHNPENQEFVVEVAFNLDISVENMKQKQFNDRYCR